MANVVLVCEELSIVIDSNDVPSCVSWQLVNLSDLVNPPYLDLSTADLSLLTSATITLLTLAFCFKVLFRFMSTDPGRGG